MGTEGGGGIKKIGKHWLKVEHKEKKNKRKTLDGKLEGLREICKNKGFKENYVKIKGLRGPSKNKGFKRTK